MQQDIAQSTYGKRHPSKQQARRLEGLQRFPRLTRYLTGGVCAALFMGIIALAASGNVDAVTAGSDDSAGAPYGAEYRVRFTHCSGPNRSDCVVDGDTFWFDAGGGARKIRIADINTPELSRARCAAEKALAGRAKARLRSLLNAGPFTLALTADGRAQDRYGRDLRIVMRGGESLGDVLVAEGLAERWQGYRRDWC